MKHPSFAFLWCLLPCLGCTATSDLDALGSAYVGPVGGADAGQAGSGGGAATGGSSGKGGGGTAGQGGSSGGSGQGGLGGAAGQGGAGGSAGQGGTAGQGGDSGAGGLGGGGAGGAGAGGAGNAGAGQGGSAGVGGGGAGGASGAGAGGAAGTAGAGGVGGSAGVGGSSGQGGAGGGGGGGAGAGGGGGAGNGGSGGAGNGGGGVGGLNSCGDGVMNGNDDCDGEDVGSLTCAILTKDPDSTGKPGCTASCQLTLGTCVNWCGNGLREGDEECDGNEFGGQTCASVVGPGSTGELKCQGCQIDTTACSVPPSCGDGVKNDTEQCDGNDFGGQTCASVVGDGWTGSLTCGPNCVRSTANCQPPAGSSSCAGLAPCGGVSCCASDTVPGGSFAMGQPGSGGDDMPEHIVGISQFVLDRHEVTVGRFRNFVANYMAFRSSLDTGQGAHPAIPDSGWRIMWTNLLPPSTNALRSALECDPELQTWTDVPGPNENKPINCVSWYEAFAFCIWDGGRLPTEAEWEYVATGGNDNRLYPWGPQAPTSSLASYECLFSGSPACSPADLPPVGSTPAGEGKFGQQDLGGSVWEWNLDIYDPAWYGKHSEPNSCFNCANLEAGASRVIRGGDFTGPADYLRATNRGFVEPFQHDSLLGFRCARNP